SASPRSLAATARYVRRKSPRRRRSRAVSTRACDDRAEAGRSLLDRIMVRSLTLMYHAVSDVLDDPLAVRIADFDRQLSDLVASGYRGATARQILERPGDGRLLHVTFDD